MYPVSILIMGITTRIFSVFGVDRGDILTNGVMQLVGVMCRACLTCAGLVVLVLLTNGCATYPSNTMSYIDQRNQQALDVQRNNEIRRNIRSTSYILDGVTSSIRLFNSLN